MYYTDKATSEKPAVRVMPELEKLGTRNLLDLPELVLDRIFFNLSNSEAIQLSLVSKQFSVSLLHNRAALSCKSYSDKDGRRYKNGKYKEELAYLCSTLKRYHDENIQLNKLEIDTCSSHSDDDDARKYNECIYWAAKNKLRSLDMTYTYKPALPESVFGVQSLVHLGLFHCDLGIEQIKVILPNLRELYLEGVNLRNVDFLLNMFKGCPSIETLSMRFCLLDEYRVFISLDKLVNLGKLKRLDLRETPIVDASFFNNFASKFPRLEYLSVGSDLGTTRIHLWSQSLKEVQLYGNYCAPLEEACFDVPNIVSFNYVQICRCCPMLPKLSFSSGKCIAKIKLKECIDDVQGSWFSRMKEFFAHLNIPYEASIHVKFPTAGAHLNEDHWMTARSNDLSFPPAGIIAGIRDFVITQLYPRKFTLSFARAILKAIFLNFRPQTIAFDWSYYRNKKVEHHVKCLWDDATNSLTSEFDEVFKLLNSYDHKDGGLTVILNLEHYS